MKAQKAKMKGNTARHGASPGGRGAYSEKVLGLGFEHLTFWATALCMLVVHLARRWSSPSLTWAARGVWWVAR